MRCAILIVSLFGTMLFGSQAKAVDLEDCSHFILGQKTDCMERNINLLNSAFQTVTAELRKAVEDLQVAVNKLNSAGFFAPGDAVQLLSNRPDQFGQTTQCADEVSPLFPSGNPNFVLSAPCTDEPRQRWTIKR
jgi:hypothetical protein